MGSLVIPANDFTKLLTIEILYYLPDYPSILQSFTWQMEDISPTYPHLDRFLTYWDKEIIAKINSVNVSIGGECGNREFRYLKDVIKLI
ncbi:MAG: hypothetical protein BGO27_00785 [Alphaproteobacteria bacterium 33-17]|nr:MAG: hypothetical protein BGO27_00785 [Alphaproteobacteria bacterium 33-17]